MRFSSMYSSVLDRLLAATVLRLPPRIDSKRPPPFARTPRPASCAFPVGDLYGNDARGSGRGVAAAGMPVAGGWRCRRTSMQAGWPDCCGGWSDANAGPGLAGGRPINMRLGIDGLWCTFSRPSGDHPAMARPMPFAIGTARGSSCCSRTAPVCGWVSAVCIKAVFASSMPPNAAPRWSRSAKTSASSST